VVEGGGGGEERALDLNEEGIAQCVWAKGYGGAFPIGDADDAEAMKLRSRRVEIFVGSAEEVQTLLGVDVEGYAKPLPQRVAEGVATFAERVLPTSLGVGAASSGAGAVGAPAAAPTTKVGRDRTRRSSLIELSAKAKASLDRDVQSLGQDPHLAQHARREEQRAALCKDEPEVLELHAQIPALGKQAFATMDVRNVGVVSVKDALSMYSRLGVDDRGVAGTSWKVSRVVWRVLLLPFSFPIFIFPLPLALPMMMMMMVHQEIVEEADAMGNGDGSLSREEWTNWIEDMRDRACSPYEISDMFDELTVIVADLRRASVVMDLTPEQNDELMALMDLAAHHEVTVE
jgi:hypothetical protein